MIARDVEVVDLNPAAWRNLHTLLDITRIYDVRPTRPNMLSVLHQGGKVLRVYAPAGYRVPVLETIDDPQETAKKLFYQLPGLDRVQILEQDSLVLFSRQVQSLEWQSPDMEEFLFRAYRLAEEDPAGLCVFPPFSWTWNGLPLEGIRTWFAASQEPTAYFLGVVRESAPWLTLILRTEGGKIRLVTTMQYLARFGFPVDQWPSSPQDLAPIVTAVTNNVAPVRAALICDYFVLARLLVSEDKRRDLQTAAMEGSAAHFGLLE